MAEPAQTAADVDAMLAQAGMPPSTPEGRAAARKKLNDAAARMTPEKWAALRARYGVQPAS